MRLWRFGDGVFFALSGGGFRWVFSAVDVLGAMDSGGVCLGNIIAKWAFFDLGVGKEWRATAERIAVSIWRFGFWLQGFWRGSIFYALAFLLNFGGNAWSRCGHLRCFGERFWRDWPCGGSSFAHCCDARSRLNSGALGYVGSCRTLRRDRTGGLSYGCSGWLSWGRPSGWSYGLLCGQLGEPVARAWLR